MKSSKGVPKGISLELSSAGASVGCWMEASSICCRPGLAWNATRRCDSWEVPFPVSVVTASPPISFPLVAEVRTAANPTRDQDGDVRAPIQVPRSQVPSAPSPKIASEQWLPFSAHGFGQLGGCDEQWRSSLAADLHTACLNGDIKPWSHTPRLGDLLDATTISFPGKPAHFRIQGWALSVWTACLEGWKCREQTDPE